MTDDRKKNKEQIKPLTPRGLLHNLTQFGAPIHTQDLADRIGVNRGTYKKYRKLLVALEAKNKITIVKKIVTLQAPAVDETLAIFDIIEKKGKFFARRKGELGISYPIASLGPRCKRINPGSQYLGQIIDWSERGEAKEGAHLIHVVKAAESNEPAIGILDDQGVISPTKKTDRSVYTADKKAPKGERHLVIFTPLKYRTAEVIETLSKVGENFALSSIALKNHDIPTEFSAQTKQEITTLDDMPAPTMEGREDLTKQAFVTIDGADARDFDDAIHAQPHPDKKGHWILSVAIADVAAYVKPGSALDTEAQERSNSVYFPDQVVPMLPEILSNNLCSLRPEENRPVLVAKLWIDEHGEMYKNKFSRAMIYSHARLTYNQVQGMLDGKEISPLKSDIDNLFSAYKLLSQARSKRGALDLDLPERKIHVDKDYSVSSIEITERFDSHRLIEEFMITANVAAAQTLEKFDLQFPYRVHDEPKPERVDILKHLLSKLGMALPHTKTLTPHYFARIIKNIEGTEHKERISQMTLRTQARAIYSPENIGHFGLSLEKYCHFTSPIRRYADLLVHRALITVLKLGDGGFDKKKPVDITGISEHISVTERRAMTAERETIDRYTALFMQPFIGEKIECRINGLSNAGLFVTVDNSGADGFIPTRLMPNDVYFYNERDMTLTAKRARIVYNISDPLTAKLIEANPYSGNVVLTLASSDSLEKSSPYRKKKKPQGRRRKPGNTKGPESKRPGSPKRSDSSKGNTPRSAKGSRTSKGPGVAKGNAPARTAKPKAPRKPVPKK